MAEALAPERVFAQSVLAGRAEVLLYDAVESQHPESFDALVALQVLVGGGMSPAGKLRIVRAIRHPQRAAVDDRRGLWRSRIHRHRVGPGLKLRIHATHPEVLTETAGCRRDRDTIAAVRRARGSARSRRTPAPGCGRARPDHHGRSPATWLPATRRASPRDERP